MQEETDDRKCARVYRSARYFVCLCKGHLVEIVLRLQYDVIGYSSVVFSPTI